MQLKQVISFVNTAKPQEALQFFRDRLGFDLVADEEFALVFDMNGSMLRVAKVPEFDPYPFTVLGWEVEDIEEEIMLLKNRGVEFLDYPQFQQDELGVWKTGRAKIAWFQDPDGNVLSFTEMND